MKKHVFLASGVNLRPFLPSYFSQMMKLRMLVRLGKSILGIALLLGAVAGHAAAQTVNAAAMQAFQASSGGAEATWKAGPNNSWEAAWVKEGQKMVYCYDNAGLLQQKKIVSDITAFPPSINTLIVAAYPQGKVEAAYKVVDRSNQKFFEVQVANAASVDRMRFNLEGKPVGKTSMTAAQPAASATPTATVAPAPVKPTPAPSPAPSPAPASVSPVKPAPQPMAMRGESATTTTKPAAAPAAELEDEDLGDLLEDDGDLDDLLKDDENWDDIELEDELDDESDLLEDSDDLDDGIDIDEDIDEDDDGV